MPLFECVSFFVLVWCEGTWSTGPRWHQGWSWFTGKIQRGIVYSLRPMSFFVVINRLVKDWVQWVEVDTSYCVGTNIFYVQIVGLGCSSLGPEGTWRMLWSTGYKVCNLGMRWASLQEIFWWISVTCRDVSHAWLHVGISLCLECVILVSCRDWRFSEFHLVEFFLVPLWVNCFLLVKLVKYLLSSLSDQPF